MIDKKSVQKIVSLITKFRVTLGGGDTTTSISNERAAELLVELEGKTIDGINVMTVAYTLDLAEASSTKALEKVLTQLGVQ